MTVFHKSPRGYERCRVGMKGGTLRGCPFGGHVSKEEMDPKILIYRRDRQKQKTVKDFKGKFLKHRNQYPVKTEDVLNPEAYDCPEDLKPALKAVLEAGSKDARYRSLDPRAQEVYELISEQAGKANLGAAPLKLDKGMYSRRYKKYDLTEQDLIEFIDYKIHEEFPRGLKNLHPTRKIDMARQLIGHESHDILFEQARAWRNVYPRTPETIKNLKEESSQQAKQYHVKPEDVLNPDAYDCPEDLKPVLKAVLEAGSKDARYAGSGESRDQEAFKLMKEQAGMDNLVAAPVKLNKRMYSSRYKKYDLTEQDLIEFAEAENNVWMTKHWNNFHPTRKIDMVYHVEGYGDYDRLFKKARAWRDENPRTLEAQVKESVERQPVEVPKRVLKKFESRFAKSASTGVTAEGMEKYLKARPHESVEDWDNAHPTERMKAWGDTDTNKLFEEARYSLDENYRKSIDDAEVRSWWKNPRYKQLVERDEAYRSYYGIKTRAQEEAEWSKLSEDERTAKYQERDFSKLIPKQYEQNTRKRFVSKRPTAPITQARSVKQALKNKGERFGLKRGETRYYTNKVEISVVESTGDLSSKSDDAAVRKLIEVSGVKSDEQVYVVEKTRYYKGAYADESPSIVLFDKDLKPIAGFFDELKQGTRKFVGEGEVVKFD